MRDNETAIFILPIVFAFVTLMVWMGNRQKTRNERLKVMQKAIESPTLDDATRRTILDALTGDQRRGSEWMTALAQHLTFLARNLVFIGGWITMFVGGALWLVNTKLQCNEEMAEGGLIATFVGFALVTAPLALREMGRRQGERA